MEFSTNTDSQTLIDFIQALTQKFQIETPDNEPLLQQVQSALKNTQLNHSFTTSFQITLKNGSQATLNFSFYLDDIDAPDIQFDGPQKFISRIEKLWDSGDF